MASDLQIQGEVVVNSEQAESAFNRVGDKAQQMANEVTTSAGKAGQAVDKIGDGAGASAEKFTRAESRISASIKRATNELELLGKTASQRLEFNISDKGLDAAKFEPALKKLRELEAQAQAAQRAASGSLDKMGISAAQTAAALRGVPAQFTDIVTSLQGGQAPLTVFLQQGGQLKDMFGGAGAAARALGGYVLGLVNPFTLAAVAVGGLGLAYAAGSKEADGYRQAIVLTGNAAGLTIGQMQQMAQQIGVVTGSQREAAGALATFATSGKVGADNLRQFTQAAIEFARVTGQSVDDVAKNFADLANDPLKATLKLNDSMNFLTESIFRQIQSLQEQGRETEAANVAQRAYADTLNERKDEIIRNLGSIEKAWAAIKKEAGFAMDAFLDIGRVSTLETRLQKAQNALQSYQNTLPGRRTTAQVAAVQEFGGVEGLQREIAGLQDLIENQRKSAQMERERAAAVKASGELAQGALKYETELEKQRREVLRATQQFETALTNQNLTTEQRNKLEADYIKLVSGITAVKEKSGRSSNTAAENKELRDQMRVLADLAGVTSTYYTELANYQKQREQGFISEKQYVGLVEDLIQKQPFAVAIAKEQADATKAQAKASEEAAKAHLKYVESFGKGAAAAQQQADQLRTEEAAAVIAADGYYSLAQAIELVTIARLEEKRDGLLGNEEAYLAVQKEIDARKELVGLIGAKEARKAAEDSAKDAAREWERSAADIERALTDSLLRGFESGKGFAKNFVDTMRNLFSTLVLRPIISAVVSPVAGAITGALGLAGTANAATSGASTLGGIGNLASLGSNLFSSGLGSTISGAIGSGVGALFGTTAGNAALGTSLGLGASSATAAAAAAAQAGGASAAAAASSASTGASIAGALPYIGAAVAALTLLAGSFKGETRYGGGFEVVNGKAFRTTGDVTNTLPESAIVQSVQGTFDSINKILGQYGSEFVATNIKAGIETSGKGRGGVFAGGLLSGGGATDIKFGKFFEDRIGASLNPEEAVKAFGGELNKAVIAALQAATDLPKYVQRQIESVDVNALGADKAAELLQTIGNLPNVLLQGFGTTRDALAQQFAQGLALGDATAAGKGVADTLVASIEASLYQDAAGKIFDIVNSGIVAPMLDAIATGASVSEALSQATIDKTIERAKAQASALSELFGNAEFVSALEQIRTTVGAALGQAGDSFGYTPKFQLQAAQQIDTAAQSASTAADEAARAWQQITDGLLTDRTTAEIALLRAQGREEEALARERAKAIEGFDAYQVGLYDGTQAILSQVTALEKQAEATKLAQERAAELASTLAGELPGAIAKFLSPDQKLAAGYTGIAADLSKVGINVDSGALATASLDQIAAAAMAVYNLGTTSDEARLALVRAASGLADLKAEATNLAASRTDAALAAVERAAQAQREVLQGTIDDVRAVFDAAASGVKSLRGQVDAVVQMSGKQGQAFIANALANARTTGYLPDGKDLQDAISAVTAGFDSAIFTTQADADYQRLVVAGNLEALQSIGGEQLTEAEKALETLDAQLQAAHDQLDALRGIQGGVLSMSEALDRFGTALARESAVRGGGGSGGGSGKPAVTLPGYLQGANGAAYDVKADMGYQAGTGLPWRGADVRSAAQQLLEAGNARGVYDAIKASGFTLAQADTILGLTAGEAEDWARSVGLPVFHSGTNFVPQTGLALLEKGEAVIPRAYNPAALGVGGNSARVEALLETMAKEIQRLQAVVAEGNGHQENTANTLGKVVVNNTLITAPAPTF